MQSKQLLAKEMKKQSKKPLVIALALFGALLVAIVVATLRTIVECPYCHNSNANVKGNCVLRQQTGSCREDYYPEHHKQADCCWCNSTGEMTMFDAWAD